MISLYFLIVTLLLTPVSQAKTVRYELNITQNSINLSGKKSVDFALEVNGSIPAPTLEFTEGDDAEIVVKNKIPDQETSVHWHGILLPPEEDGVSYVNTPPIMPGKEHVFRFKIRQHGTYWYHSHTMTQEQEGVFGAIVIHPKKKILNYDKDLVVVLSDWADESGDDILRNLKKDGDYYLYKKGTMRSWLGAMQAGKLGSYLKNEWTRMGGMDLSDVGYDAFLINGKRDSQILIAKGGEKIRIRIINAAASTYFHVALGQSPMTVVSADGTDIEPIKAKELLMGMAETYDVIFQVPVGKNVELRATAQDGTGYASAMLGENSKTAEKISAPLKAMPDAYASMEHSVNHSEHQSEHHSEHQSMHKHTSEPVVIETMTVDHLKSKAPTQLKSSKKTHEVKLVLGGDMRRYVWHINGKALFQDRNIMIDEGDIIRLTFENDTMMHHPMHLHGHFFRVLNSQGDHSPLKHTVDVGPHESRTIEFLADEPGEWMLHCHNLFHMTTGMARVVKYSTFTPSPEIAHLQHQDHHLHDPWYNTGAVELATNHAQARFRLTQTWNEIDARIKSTNKSKKNFSIENKIDKTWELEGDFFYRRWFGQYLNLMGGGTHFDERTSATIGVGYLLPMLISSQALVDHRGGIRLDLDKRFQWSKTIFSDVDFSWRLETSRQKSNEIEYEVSLMYGSDWHWSLGLMLTQNSLGAGLQVQF